MFVPHISIYYTGYCWIETGSEFWNGFLYFLTQPLCDLAQVTMFLYLFWRKPLSSQAQNLLLMSQNSHSFLQTSLIVHQARTNSKLTNSNSGLRASKKELHVKVPESTIFIAMSEGNTPDDDKESENQDDLLYQ